MQNAWASLLAPFAPPEPRTKPWWRLFCDGRDGDRAVSRATQATPLLRF